MSSDTTLQNLPEKDVRAIARRVLLLCADLAAIDANYLDDAAQKPDMVGHLERQSCAAAIAAAYNALHDLKIESNSLLRAYLALEMIEEGRTKLAMLVPPKPEVPAESTEVIEKRGRPATTERIEEHKARLAAVAFARGGNDKTKDEKRQNPEPPIARKSARLRDKRSLHRVCPNNPGLGQALRRGTTEKQCGGRVIS